MAMRHQAKMGRNWLRWTAFVGLLLLFIFSAYQMIGYICRLNSEQKALEQVEELMESAQVTDEIENPADLKATMLPGWDALYAINPDAFAWLEIEDTPINYPVMFAPDKLQYYLYRDLRENHSQSGMLYIDEACFEGCGNYLIHGHNMRNNTMFGTLEEYADPEYGETHRKIRFNTLWEEGEYEVVAAFYAKIYTDDSPGFRYYEYTDLTKRAVFEEYIAQAQKAALYETGVEANFGDELITLSTCVSHAAEERFVVVARRVAEK